MNQKVKIVGTILLFSGLMLSLEPNVTDAKSPFAGPLQGKVIVLGFGGTIAGTAKSPFNRDYVAAQACLAGNKKKQSKNPEAIYSITNYLSKKLNKQPPPSGSRKNYRPESIFQCKAIKKSICGKVSKDCIPQSCTVAVKTKYLNVSEKVDFCDIERIDSAKAGPKDWVKMGKSVEALVGRKDVKGVVITHGTDTLEETAYFLNLVLKTDKPVIVVGAMRASNHISADGYMNLMNAILLAANPQASKKGVLVLLNDRIYGARDVSKTNTTNVDTFKAKNTGPIGTSYFGVSTFYGQPTRKHTKATPFTVKQFEKALKRGRNNNSLKSKFETAILYDYAAGNSDIYKSILKNGKFRGLVLATTGNGGMSTGMECAINQSNKGYLIALSSRTGSGIETNIPGKLCSQKIKKSKFFSANDLNPQKARVLMVVGLSVLGNKSQAQALEKLVEYFSKY